MLYHTTIVLINLFKNDKNISPRKGLYAQNGHRNFVHHSQTWKQHKFASNYFIFIQMTSALHRKNAVTDLPTRMTFISLFLWEKKMLDTKEQYLVASEWPGCDCWKGIMTKEVFWRVFFWGGGFGWVGTISLQCCVSFCCTRKGISSMYTYTPLRLNLPPTAPIPPIWSSQSTNLSSPCSTLVIYLIFVKTTLSIYLILSLLYCAQKSVF